MRSISLAKAIIVGAFIPCERAFSDIARPIRPFPSSKGWMVSKWMWAMAARRSGDRLDEALNQLMKSVISR